MLGQDTMRRPGWIDFRRLARGLPSEISTLPLAISPLELHLALALLVAPTLRRVIRLVHGRRSDGHDLQVGWRRSRHFHAHGAGFLETWALGVW